MITVMMKKKALVFAGGRGWSGGCAAGWPALGRVRIYGKGHNQPADGSGKGVFDKAQNSLGVIILALLYLNKSN